jgi:hypothetical protein
MSRMAPLRRVFPTFAALFGPIRWVGKSRRRLRVTALVMVAFIASAPLWWVTQLIGLPDIGEPFDVASFRAGRVADERNAFVLYARAASVQKPAASYLAKAKGKNDIHARWSAAGPEVHHWVDDNRTALAIFRAGVERPDALDLSTGMERESYRLLQAILSFRTLALLEASRLEDLGEMAAAWAWYRAIVRSIRHVAMRGAIYRRNSVQKHHRRLRDRLTNWSHDPRTAPALIRQALEDLIACEALAPSDLDSLKNAYLGINELLDSEHTPGRDVPLMRFRRFYNPEYQLNPEQIQAIWDGWRFLRHEPERSRRVIKLLTAHWLAYFALPVDERPKSDPRVASMDLYPLGLSSPAKARMLAPEALDAWFETAYDAQQVLQYLDPTRIQTIEQANHVDLLILLASELYLRDHGTDPPAPDVLVGPYLKRLPADFLENPKKSPAAAAGRRAGG